MGSARFELATSTFPFLSVVANGRGYQRSALIARLHLQAKLRAHRIKIIEN